jgi:hypothetical protein
VERLEEIQRELPEGEEATPEMVIDRYYQEADNARDAVKNK